MPPAAPGAPAEVLGMARGATQTGRGRQPTEPADSGTQTGRMAASVRKLQQEESGFWEGAWPAQDRGVGEPGPAQVPAPGLGQGSPCRSHGRGWGQVSEQ